ncbi:aminotransferase class III-fold pyridoxal phosphate-dependent enzyme, partial [Francisella tularensis]|uniref:aminotransferase class III-fold pyridoxal phosphate-dependent enzyme n=1 Tax=Francisella tularensis TaxID=263 RepID=UPI002381AEFA
VGQEFPRFRKCANGAYLYDVDWNKYIDYIGSWGPMILGLCDDDVLEAIQCQVKNGLSYGEPCKQEVDLAKKIIELMPN